MSKNYNIPFNKPCLVGSELDYVAKALQSNAISGDGFFTKQCHRVLEEELGVAKVLLTTSCTHALEMAAILLDIQHDDEVIVPCFTFVSTINAFVLRGAKPVFIDIRSDTLNLDETQLEKLITPKTKAIIPVHYGGVGCEMDTIMDVSKKYNIPVIEDNAHGLLGKYKGQFLGTFGVMATQSFHETKNFSCGEGGALLVNNPDLYQRAEIIREKGTNRSRFFRGEVDKYTWVDIGSSYLPSDILAALLLAQLEKRDYIQAKRKRIWEKYYIGLKDWAEANNVRVPVVPKDCEQAYHLFYILLPSLEKRHELIQYLKENSVLSVFHYLPLHLSDMGRKFGGKQGDCPVTEELSQRLLRLPFFYSFTENEQDFVIKLIKTKTL